MQKYQKWFFIVSLIGVFFFGQNIVSAQSYSGTDVFWAMNDIRAVFGLEPFVMRDDLMQLAQGHAEYMAVNEKLTHTRADGTQPNVTSENISLGPIQVAVNTWMDDQPHKDTILAWSKGWAGAGVALSENGYVYICFDMIRMSDAQYNQVFDPYPPIATEDPNLPTLAPGEATRTPVPGGSQIITDVQISTPDAGGYIWHEVKSGQTLWAIATKYGNSEERIAGLNSLKTGDTTIYIGQKLLIDIVDPPAPTTTATITPEITMTQTPTKTLTAAIIPSVTPELHLTPTPTIENEQGGGDGAGWWFGGGGIIIAGGLYWVYKKGWLPELHP